MAQHTRDLGFAADAKDRAHRSMQRLRTRQPPASLAFVEAAIEHELHVEAAQTLGRLEHLALNLARVIPGGLAARRRIHGEYQATAPACRPGRRHRLHLTQESLDLGVLRRCWNWRLIVFVGRHSAYMVAKRSSFTLSRTIGPRRLIS